MPGRLRVTQVKSTISHIGRNRATVRALGLHGIGSTVEIPDNDATRGMVRQVRFLVSFEEVEGADSTVKPSKAAPAAKRGSRASAEETK
jgi:large subunit ribosomal protein L30